MSTLNLADIRYCTESEGPGKRIAIWVQGCQRACPGCCNPEMQALEPANIIDSSMLCQTMDDALKMYPSIEGITFVGGEPILQAAGVADIAEWIQSHGKSVLLFTGYLFEELEHMANTEVDVRRLLEHTDLLIDGPFLKDCYDNERAWIGSTNQRVFHLSKYYPDGIEFFQEHRSMEIHLDGSYAYFNGWPFDIQLKNGKGELP